jgi:hypothetical protein
VSRRPARFTQAEARRASRVAKAEGMAVDMLPNGVIRLVPATLLDLQNRAKPGEANPWDE